MGSVIAERVIGGSWISLEKKPEFPEKKVSYVSTIILRITSMYHDNICGFLKLGNYPQQQLKLFDFMSKLDRIELVRRLKKIEHLPTVYQKDRLAQTFSNNESSTYLYNLFEVTRTCDF